MGAVGVDAATDGMKEVLSEPVLEGDLEAVAAAKPEIIVVEPGDDCVGGMMLAVDVDRLSRDV